MINKKTCNDNTKTIIINEYGDISDNIWSTPDQSPVDDLIDLRNFFKYHTPEDDE
jgi:hypothetical protein